MARHFFWIRTDNDEYESWPFKRNKLSADRVNEEIEKKELKMKLKYRQLKDEYINDGSSGKG